MFFWWFCIVQAWKILWKEFDCYNAVPELEERAMPRGIFRIMDVMQELKTEVDSEHQ